MMQTAQPRPLPFADGRTAWLRYSGNFAKDWRGTMMQEKPPGSHYGLVLQQIRLLDENTRLMYER
jgi:hypothetical protein